MKKKDKHKIVLKSKEILDKVENLKKIGIQHTVKKQEYSNILWIVKENFLYFLYNNGKNITDTNIYRNSKKNQKNEK